MDVSLLALATAGAFPDEAAILQPGTAAPADAFAKLLSGLEGAPIDKLGLVTTEVAADGDAVSSPIDPALLLAVKAMPVAAKGNPDETAPAAPLDEPEAGGRSEPEAPTAASLGLPPLLAALVAPTLSQAAVAPIAGAKGDALAHATAGPTLSPSPPSPAAAAPSLPAAPMSEPIAMAAEALASPAASPPPASPAPPLAAPVGDAVAAPANASGKPAAVNSELRTEPAEAPDAGVPVIAATLTPSRPVPVADRRAPVTPAASGGEKSVKETAPAAIKPLPTLTAAVIVPPPIDSSALAPAAGPVSGGELASAPADMMVEHQLDLAIDGEWLDQLAKDIVRTAATEGSLRFKLNPENLGSLHVEVTQGQAGASVRLTADTEQARAIIADARPQLVAEARAQGVRIAETHVDLGGQGSAQAHSQAGNGSRHHRDAPAQEYLTSWKPESAEEEATPRRRQAAERYA